MQSAIQTLRTVTFILQKHRRAIPEFDSWYGDWQTQLKSDPLMRWMVEARNRIEKEGDLEANSFVRAQIVASHLDGGPRFDIPARLFEGPAQLIKRIPNGPLGRHFRDHGILRIERRWVENSLPDYELLEALAIAYGRISLVVDAAHVQIGIEVPPTLDMHTGERFDAGERAGRLPCMIGHREKRSLNLSLSDGQPIELERSTNKFDIDAAEASAKRYGISPEKIFGNNKLNEEAILSNLFDTARSVFLKDGYHVSIFFLLKNCQVVKIYNMMPEDQRQKYLMMRDLALVVTTYGADAVIGLGEVWSAPADPLKPYQRPADSPDRQEMLTGTLVTKGGDAIHLAATIERDGPVLRLGNTQTERDTAAFAFAPVYEAWGRPIPERWMRQEWEMFGPR